MGTMSKNKRKRPQTPKTRNEPLMRANQGLRFSNAAEPHKSKKAYVRKPKHKEW
jgi:hypothetical protein